ncbi:protein kinase domain-containing protein [Rubinisphaera italica]|uniref:Serine/threonine-protein kinase PrkC n=1 Tax=Rubinisphaera italica TaxID=2527969 RepID=A0A5C5XHT6_9PLAN|nr:HDOD domain-containing protein [Rubinisphaera italica]TWT62279.1 Serine/threonine-protein kinase PrkC [Rubinisphaera italica]
MSQQTTSQVIDWSAIRVQLLPEGAESLLPSSWKLPILPQAVSEFLQHASNPNYDIKKLTKIVEQDTSLSCKLLKHVNSSALGLRHRISTIRNALMALGIRRSKMLILTAAVHATVKKFNSRLFDLHEFWADNLERARFSRAVAEKIGADVDLAYTGAMLQDFLIPILGHTNLKEYVSYWNDSHKPVCDLYEYEHNKFGVQHAQVGAICLMKWNVPDDLICSILCHHMDYEHLDRLGLVGTHVQAVAASSLIPTSILQHRELAIPLSIWDQHDSGYDLFEIAEKVDSEYTTEKDAGSHRESLAVRIEECLMSHLSSGGLLTELKNRQLGNYILEECIGNGASGSVYRARHTMMNRPAAVKVLSQEKLTESDIARFEREVQLTSLLQHANTVSIYDFGRTNDGMFYYAMEYVNGYSLKQLVQLYGPQPEGRVIPILKQVCGSIENAHRAGLVHRDIKPENILLSRKLHMSDHATVLDFGLVRNLQEEDGSNEKVITGTPLYLAPETISTMGTSSISSDLYAIGAVGYFLLTGQPLFTGNNAVDICLKQLSEVPISPSKRLGRKIDEDLERLIMNCLNKSIEKRPDSAFALAEQLARCEQVSFWNEDQAAAWWEAQSSLPEETRLGENDPTLICDLDETK